MSSLNGSILGSRVSLEQYDTTRSLSILPLGGLDNSTADMIVRITFKVEVDHLQHNPWNGSSLLSMQWLISVVKMSDTTIGNCLPTLAPEKQTLEPRGQYRFTI